MFSGGVRVVFKIMKPSKLPKITLALDSDSSDSISNYTYEKTKLKPIQQPSSHSTSLTSVKHKPNNIQYHIQTLKAILKFRTIVEAPVDTMGCDQLYDHTLDTLSQKFQILVSIMLSIQTKDQTTSDVVRNMVNQGVLQPKVISQMSEEEVGSLIKRVNYHKTKARNLIKAAQSFLQNGAPKTYEDVLKFPGVGVKVATLYIKVAEGVNIGIGTDTHVHRIVNKLGWVSTKNPQDTEHRLRDYFPQQYWQDMNHALVGFGQTICEAKKPKCKECPISDRCPSSNL